MSKLAVARAKAGNAMKGQNDMRKTNIAMKKELNALRVLAAANAKPCEWKHHDADCYWSSACGVEWQFSDEGPIENGMKYCHGCGKPLTVNGMAS